ncbi:hypothetical protein [Bacillus salipaludis]|uniref:hypothetical protein n=1 Tax=Bacillus salipaludis TaxID=2547811 RepID=UPI002E21B428|nr:hypothetical protein [Bacillus salipaludis]
MQPSANSYLHPCPPMAVRSAKTWKKIGTEDSKLLSRRELEGMKMISWGECTKEMADSMEKLLLKHFTEE